jgi:hypothetical protein
VTALDGTDVVDTRWVAREGEVFGVAALSLAILMREAAEAEVIDVPLRPKIRDSKPTL